MPKKAAAKKPSAVPKKRPIRREIGALACAFAGVFTVLGLFGQQGKLLTFLATAIRLLIGQGVYFMPVFFCAAAWALLRHRGRPVTFRVLCCLASPLLIGTLASLGKVNSDADVKTLDFYLAETGVLTGFVSSGLRSLVGIIGGSVFVGALLFFALIAAFRINFPKIFQWIKDLAPYEELPPPTAAPEPKRQEAAPPERRLKPSPPRERERRELIKTANEHKKHIEQPSAFGVTELPEGFTPADAEEIPFDLSAKPAAPPEKNPPAEKPVIRIDKPSPPVTEKPRNPIASFAPPPPVKVDYPYPPLSLLQASVGGQTGDSAEETISTTAKLAEVLTSFRIDASPVNVVRGPSVARYEFELAQGTSLSRITNRASDIALNLGVDGVRISPVPGLANIVGIEVPNKTVSTVFLRDVLDNPVFRDAQSKLTFALGKDIGGKAVLADIAKLTHVLIAGTTGSGKSVCVNSLIISLLYKANPDEVKLILIDPKMVELGIYNGVPHLLVPVVTDPQKASAALQWAVREMERRYFMLQERNVRDIFSYNASIEKMPELPKMPQIVIIIDELADLMMVAGKEVEDSVIRIAQKARAAGMHLILATQRPSANVITGLMKSNIPSRVAFAVASGIDSRIILDETGAEDLIGRGDMLFAPLGAKISRVQGCLITGSEVEAVVEHIRRDSRSAYSDEVLSAIENPEAADKKGKKTVHATSASEGEDDGQEWDPLLNDAMQMILDVDQASKSMLQRRLKLGYARAARIVDQLELKGWVGSAEGSKPGQILITKDQFFSLTSDG